MIVIKKVSNIAYKNPLMIKKENFLKDVCQLQKEYKKLVDSKTMTKKAICDLCIPFRNKYHLTDYQTLTIARKEYKGNVSDYLQ